ARSIRETQQLGDGGAQDVAVDRSHALHAPVFSMRLDQSVNFRGAVSGDAKQVVGEAAHISTYGIALVPERAAYFFKSLLSHVSLKEHLQREFAGFASCTQKVLSPQLSAVSL